MNDQDSSPLRYIDPDGRAPQLVGIGPGGEPIYGPDVDWGDYDPNWGGRGAGRRADDYSRLPWNQRPDVSQGLQFEGEAFDIIGGSGGITVGGCCDNNKRRVWVRGEACFGLGIGEVGKVRSGKAFAQAIKGIIKGAEAMKAALEFDKKCPLESWNFDVRIEGSAASWIGAEASYSLAGFVGRLTGDLPNGTGNFEARPIAGEGAAASVKVCVQYLYFVK